MGPASASRAANLGTGVQICPNELLKIEDSPLL